MNLRVLFILLTVNLPGYFVGHPSVGTTASDNTVFYRCEIP